MKKKESRSNKVMLMIETVLKISGSYIDGNQNKLWPVSASGFLGLVPASALGV